MEACLAFSAPPACRGKAVALDIACGLRFLHTAKPNPILHLDLVSCVSPLLPVCLCCAWWAAACVFAMLPMRLCCAWPNPHRNAPDSCFSLPVRGRPHLVCPAVPDHLRSSS